MSPEKSLGGFLITLFVGAFVLGALKEIIPLVARMIDAILLWIFRAAFRLGSRGQLSPYQRGLRRATEGALLVASSCYAATWFPVFLGQSLGGLAQGLMRAPADHLGIAAFFIIVALGLIWLVAGMRGARGGDRDWMSAFWSALIAGGCLAALWCDWFPSPDGTGLRLLEIAGLKTLTVSVAAAGLVRLWLTLPMLGNARGIVAGAQRRRARPMRPAG